MAAFRSGNPALNSNTFLEEAEKALAKRQGMSASQSNSNIGDSTYDSPGQEREITGIQSDSAMTLDGTVRASAVLLILLVISGGLTWYGLAQNMMAAAVLIPIGLIGGFCIALFTVFKKEFAPISSPFYAIFEGMALGGISFYYETQYHGIVLQSAGLTVAILAALLLAYTSRLIKPSENFKLGVVAATGGIALMYLANWIMSMFHMPFTFLSDAGPVGIAISGVIVVIAALNLVLDFDFIETGVEAKAPKYMEWYGAFGLLVTLIWLYLEILRLMSKLSSKRN
jgi:uncharacterized YccA/Bax inhibitor family protein